ncbi:hypothetical protein CXF95_11605 [Paraglaciecola sp. MB-3u-78]|jgi:hypothetical protein|nr:hypothetical protein CXF95_11605 [Paraglaciecola sp. MB-3u-78]
MLNALPNSSVIDNLKFHTHIQLKFHTHIKDEADADNTAYLASLINNLNDAIITVDENRRGN